MIPRISQAALTALAGNTEERKPRVANSATLFL